MLPSVHTSWEYCTRCERQDIIFRELGLVFVKGIRAYMYSQIPIRLSLSIGNLYTVIRGDTVTTKSQRRRKRSSKKVDNNGGVVPFEVLQGGIDCLTGGACGRKGNEVVLPWLPGDALYCRHCGGSICVLSALSIGRDWGDSSERLFVDPCRFRRRAPVLKSTSKFFEGRFEYFGGCIRETKGFLCVAD